MQGTPDPIYAVAMHYPPKEIHLISSDEPPLQGRGSSEENYELIQNHFSRTNTRVTHRVYPLEYFEENVFDIAKQIVQQYQQDPDTQIVLDLSAGRGTIRQAISRAGEVAIDYIHKFFNPEAVLIYTIQSRKKPVIAYTVGKNFIPEQKDAELLRMVDQPMTQTRLSRELAWSNQAEVSKSLQRLIELGLVNNLGHKHRELTELGKQVQDFLQSL
jgi:hypothetical protein